MGRWVVNNVHDHGWLHGWCCGKDFDRVNIHYSFNAILNEKNFNVSLEVIFRFLENF
jgi:hypothetical protein